MTIGRKHRVRLDVTISLLASKCPWFEEHIDNDEGPYSVLGSFAIYLRDGIATDKQMNEAFEFLNSLGASDNQEIQNKLVVGALEILTDTDESIALAKEKLQGQALELFNRTLSGWRHE